MLGRLYSVATFSGSEEEIGNQEIEKYFISSGKSLNELKRFIILSEPLTLDTPVHSFQPGDHIHIKTGKSEALQERGKDLI